MVGLVRKHRAPKGALRRGVHDVVHVLDAHRSESTERQKVHYDLTETKPSQITSGVRKHRTHQISHVIPFFQLCTNSQKSQNFNDPTSNIETTGRELRATFLRNYPRPAPNGEIRRLNISLHNVLAVSQKAPSAKRCIKTPRSGS